eukprot:TRINITY_DN13419_c0_g1_i1.p1 TRINITY_DN13419_c0_g1~~TRINITY_DN13419_c0_g1_i1.p1  ORF type:complete len:308 (-),score=59.85 TRINITY_DN13419_c0_g1_i1:78-1001(-)
MAANMGAEAKVHVQQAEKALKPSWMSLKFAPDYLIASMEYQQAATKYRSANLLSESVDAWIKSAEAKLQIRDQFGAGRAYESAAAICAGGGPGGDEAALAHWSNAIACLRLAGKGEIAAKLFLKQAETYEKQNDTLNAKEALESTIEVYADDEKDHMLGDVYKKYIGFLIRTRQLEDALKAIDQHVALLQRQGHASFVYKELLAKVVLLLEIGDSVRAEEALAPGVAVQGWFTSKECILGNDLVAAYRSNDAEAAAAALKDQTFTFLQIEVARIARQLRVIPVTVASAEPGEPEQEMTKEQMEDLLT